MAKTTKWVTLIVIYDIQLMEYFNGVIEGVLTEDEKRELHARIVQTRKNSNSDTGRRLLLSLHPGDPSVDPDDGDQVMAFDQRQVFSLSDMDGDRIGHSNINTY